MDLNNMNTEQETEKKINDDSSKTATNNKRKELSNKVFLFWLFCEICLTICGLNLLFLCDEEMDIFAVGEFLVSGILIIIFSSYLTKLIEESTTLKKHFLYTGRIISPFILLIGVYLSIVGGSFMLGVRMARKVIANPLVAVANADKITGAEEAFEKKQKWNFLAYWYGAGIKYVTNEFDGKYF